MSAVAIATSVGTSATKATGRPYQNHLFWDSINSLWWLLVYTSTQTLSAYSSPDFSTWTARTTLTLTNAHASEGRNLAVAYSAISSTAVLHVQNQACPTGTGTYKPTHVRGTISGTTITWGAEATVTSNQTNNFGGPSFAGESVAVDSNGTVIVADPYLSPSSSDMQAIRSTNTDSGTIWTAGFPANASVLSTNTTNAETSSVAVPYGVGKTFAVGDDAGGASNGSWKQLLSSNWGGSSWSASANVLSASLGTAQDANDWNAILVGSTIYIVYRTGSNTYGVRTTTNGTTFSTGTAPPNQTSLAGGGIGLATDGASLWVGIIDSDTANTVRYVKWNGTAWDASWTALETTTATRTALTSWPSVVSNSIGFAWTQTNGSNNDIYGELLSVGGGTTLNVSMSGGVTTGGSASIVVVISMSGGTVSGGSAPISENLAISGGLASGGSASISASVATSGGLTSGGSAATATSLLMAGGVVTGGSSPTGNPPLSMSGGVSTGGTVIISETLSMSGGVATSGSASIRSTLAAGGGVVLGGASGIAVVLPPMSGGIVTGGSVPPPRQIISMQGGVSTGGASTVMIAIETTGGLAVSGAAVATGLGFQFVVRGNLWVGPMAGGAMSVGPFVTGAMWVGSSAKGSLVVNQ